MQRRTGLGEDGEDGGAGDDGGDVADLDAPAPERAAGAAPAPPRRWSAAARRPGVLVALAAGAALLLALPPQPRAEQLFPVLAEPAATGTGFLGEDLLDELGVVDGSERLLAVTPTALFWVARDRGGVCLLLRDLTLTGGTSGRCAPAAEVAARGLALDAADPRTAGVGGSAVGAVLLPAGLDGTDLRAEGYTEVSSGLWLDGATAAAVVEAAVDGTATRVVVVPSESHRGSSDLPAVLTSAGATYAVVVACLPPPDRQTDAQVRIGRGGGRPHGAIAPDACRDGTVAHTFVGDGRPVRVRVQTPDDLVWAASVVECTGPLSRPTC